MTLETAAKKEIADGLRAMGWKVIRIQSGVIPKAKRYIHCAENGTPDLLCFDREGVGMWCEVKAAFGKRSQAQLDFWTWAQAMKHRYVLAKSLDDVLEYLCG